MTAFFGIIYIITNKINGKQYVGQTTRSLLIRFGEHCDKRPNYHSLIYYAIQKYGQINFYIDQIDVAYSKEELDWKEKYYIQLLNSLIPNGYNFTEGGRGISHHSEESKFKISKALRGNTYAKGYVHSEATRKKRSLSMMGKNKGKYKGIKRGPLSPEACKKVSLAKMGHEVTAETRQKLSIANTGRKVQEDTKEKISTTMKQKGTSRGTSNANAKLTETQVREIKIFLFEGDLKQTEIATIYGVDKTIVWQIKNNRIWTHIEL